VFGWDVPLFLTSRETPIDTDEHRYTQMIGVLQQRAIMLSDKLLSVSFGVHRRPSVFHAGIRSFTTEVQRHREAVTARSPFDKLWSDSAFWTAWSLRSSQ
jgi:hypothetical protein